MRSLLLSAVLMSLPGMSSAAISVVIGEDAGGVYMRATGSYDVSEALKIPYGVKMGTNAMIGAPIGIYGWATGELVNSDIYGVAVSGLLDGFDLAIDATSVTTNLPFMVGSGLFKGPEYIFFSLPKDSPVTGTVDNRAYFEGTTLDSLGLTLGQSMTWSWTGDNVTVSVIPEPTTCLLGSVGALAFLRRRR